MRPLGAAVREAVHGPRRVWVFNGALALTCSLVWAFDIGTFGSPTFVHGPHLQWWALAAAFYIAEVFVVHLQFRKEAHSLSLTERWRPRRSGLRSSSSSRSGPPP